MSTQVLEQIESAEARALLSESYDELRRMARIILRGDRMHQVMQTTELAHEAALRLIQSRVGPATDQGHLLALAARSMRQVLIDEVRKSRAAKRQTPEVRTLWPGDDARQIDLERLDEALEALTQFSPEHARIIELRFTLGLTVEETALATGMPERTIKRRWQSARIWLHDYMSRLDHTTT